MEKLNSRTQKRYEPVSTDLMTEKKHSIFIQESFLEAKKAAGKTRHALMCFLPLAAMDKMRKM